MSYTEPYDKMDAATTDIAKAITSLREELEAVDFYNQRCATAKDEELKRIMAHNRDEEKEHAVMLMEWLRRNQDNWDKEMKDYIFTTAPLGVHGEESEAEKEPTGDLGIGKL